MKSKKFQDLILWQKAHTFVLDVYKLTQKFPKEEIFGLTSQFRRAAVSIPANIAEGFRRQSKNDKIRFYNISQGSIEECKYYLILSSDLNYSLTETHYSLLEEVSKLLEGYIKSIRSSDS
jgi:four helix bundle protein